MSNWIKTCKGILPSAWNFAKQPNKWGYLNNPRWLTTARAFQHGGPDDYDGRESEEPQVWTPPDGSISYSRNSQGIHHQCGHWHMPIPVVLDDLFILHGAPVIPGSGDGRDQCHKVNKSTLVTIIQYGEPGAGINQLQCPWGICVDDTHVWICDVNNYRIMQRLKSDLTYVNHIAVPVAYNPRCIHTKDGLLFWEGGLGHIRERLKSDLSLVRSVVSAVGGDNRGTPFGTRDLTCDDTYLYAADEAYKRVHYYDLATLTHAGEFGYYPYWTALTYGVAYGGGYLFISDSGVIRKINPSTFARIGASYGHLTGGYGAGNIKAGELFADATKVYAVNTTNSHPEVHVLDHSLNNLAVISHASLLYPYSVYADASYIYVSDLDSIKRFDATTYAYVDTITEAFSYLSGMVGDDTYLYVADQNTDFRVVRFLKATMAYVDEYTDVGWAVFGSPISLTVDGTYIYVVENSPQLIHRIDKATMAYVDSMIPASTFKTAQSVVEGSEIFVGEYNKAANGGGVQCYNKATMALIRESPLTQGDSGYWLTSPWGITCDETYIYVGDTGTDKIKIFDRVTHDPVGEISVPNVPRHIAVDATYLYVVCLGAMLAGYASETYKYLKTSPYTLVSQRTEQYGISLDTAYIYQS